MPTQRATIHKRAKAKVSFRRDKSDSMSPMAAAQPAMPTSRSPSDSASGMQSALASRRQPEDTDGQGGLKGVHERLQCAVHRSAELALGHIHRHLLDPEAGD